MRIVLTTLLITILLFGFSKLVQVFTSGKAFDAAALKASFRESAKTIWQGMQLFVIVWIVYLLLLWWIRHRN